MGEYMGRSSLHIQRRTNQQIQTTRNNMSVSFKVTLSNGEEQEIRRFQVDKEVAGSLGYLKQKIAAIFPEFRRGEPVLSWVDEDGDEVVVTSDEELQVALTALTGPVYKLKAKVADKANDEGHPGMARGGQAHHHHGVVCDGCDGPVAGPRYKCLICPDYDLCATCEARGLHVHHKMIRLPAPCKRVAPRCHLARQVNPIRKASLFARERKRDYFPTGHCWATPADPRPGGSSSFIEEWVNPILGDPNIRM